MKRRNMGETDKESSSTNYFKTVMAITPAISIKPDIFRSISNIISKSYKTHFICQLLNIKNLKGGIILFL